MRRALVRVPALPLSRLIAAAALILAGIGIGVYLWAAGHRIGYPYELDWLEGGTVELVNRAVHGGGLYSPPTLGFVGFTYTPLYSYLCAAVAELTGVGFLPLRIVSLASSLVVMGVLGAYVRDITASWVAGVVAAGIFAACYHLTGDFYDIGRLDSMFLALSLLSLWLGRRAGSLAGGIGVGVVAFLAFFTKQVGLVVVVPALVVALPFRPRAMLGALITLVVLCGASTLILDAATDNWYRYYIVGELAGQPRVAAEYAGFWRYSLYASLKQLTLLALLGALAALWQWRRTVGQRAGGGHASGGRVRWLAWARSAGLAGPAYDVAAALGLLVTAWVSVLHSGGYLNVLMPAYAAAAGIGGWAFAALARRGWLGGLIAVVLLAWQFHVLLQNPVVSIPDQAGLVVASGSAIPDHRDRVAGEELITALRRLPGPVLVLRHPWYGTLAGKGSFSQADGIAEVLRSSGARGATDLTRQLRGALNRYHIRAVVLDSGESPPPWLAPQLAADFRRVAQNLTRIPLAPPTDIQTAPETLYLRIAH